MRQLTVTGQYDLSVRCTVYDLSEHLGGYLGTLYDLSEHLGGRRVRGLIGPARIEPPVAALQTTLVPRRHQLYPMRAPQSTSEVCPRPRTVTRGVTAPLALVFARTSLALARTPVRTAIAPVTAPPKRRRAHKVFTECSQDDARGGRCLWFWRLRRRAIRSREDQKRRGAARVVRAVRGGEGCEGGEGRRVAHRAAVQCEEVRRWRGLRRRGGRTLARTTWIQVCVSQSVLISAHQCSSVLISAPWLGPPGSKWPLQAPPPPCLLPRSSPHP